MSTFSLVESQSIELCPSAPQRLHTGAACIVAGSAGCGEGLLMRVRELIFGIVGLTTSLAHTVLCTSDASAKIVAWVLTQ
jgi:hypothetical protein